jgi:hypothetical protein
MLKKLMKKLQNILNDKKAEDEKNIIILQQIKDNIKKIARKNINKSLSTAAKSGKKKAIWCVLPLNCHYIKAHGCNGYLTYLGFTLYDKFTLEMNKLCTEIENEIDNPNIKVFSDTSSCRTNFWINMITPQDV